MHNALWYDNDIQAFQGVMSVEISVRRLHHGVTARFCSKIIILLIVSVVSIKERKTVCLLWRGRGKQSWDAILVMKLWAPAQNYSKTNRGRV